MNKSKNLASVSSQCVACGSCLKVCPMGAINIQAGVIARVDSDKCIGCGKCAKTCPADVITVIERGTEA